MNGKLIALLIRSNATLIEAIGELSRQLDTAGNYSENNFWNLRQEVIAMAEEAESLDDVQPTTVITGCPENVEELLADAVRKHSKFKKGSHANNPVRRPVMPVAHPIMPISPSHQKGSVNDMQPSDLTAGTYYHGIDGANVPYFARIDGLSNYSNHIEGTERAVYSFTLGYFTCVS